MQASSPGLHRYSCEEYEHVDIDPAALLDSNQQLRINPEIHGRDAFRVYFVNGKLRLQASSLVGVIPLNEQVTLTVKPRVPIANLTRMVVDTNHPTLALSALREYRGHGTANDWVLDLYADSLLDRIDDLLDRGLYRTYVRFESEGSFPRGRIDFNRTVSRFTSRDVPYKVAYQRFERTADNAVNRCLKAALLKTHAHLTRDPTKPAKGTRTKLKRLSGQLMALQDVAEDHDWHFLDDEEVRGRRELPEPRHYYRSALDLSLLILENRGLALESEGSDVTLSSLLINTNDLFEAFVRVSLQREARRREWPPEVLDGNKEGNVPLFDVPGDPPAPFGEPMSAIAESSSARAKPDVIFRMPDGRIPLVGEIKNTVRKGESHESDTLPDRTEVNQIVTYAQRYGLKTALLIHPWKHGTKGLAYVGRVETVDLFDFRIDLSVENLDMPIAQMADAVEKLIELSEAQAPDAD